MGNPISERGPKVRVVASPSTWVEGESLRQLDASAELAGMQAVVGMPDLHPGKGGPVGAAFLSRGWIHPALVGGDVGCGMQLSALDLPVRKLRPERVATMLDGLDRPWEGDVKAWLGARGVEETPYDLALGTPGRGNHMIEVQSVHEVVDGAALSLLGIDPAMACLLVHSGSRGLGESVLHGHAARFGAAGVRTESAEASGYMQSHDHAVRWARANRDLCTLRTCQALGAEASPVLDLCHNSVTAETFSGCRCWLHRKGAAPSDSGYVVIPGSRGDLTALVRPVPGRDDVLRSVAHGAGRKIARGEARGKLAGLHRRQDLRRNPWGGRVVCGEDALAWEEAAECYKPLASVVGDLEEAGLVEVVAWLRPLCTFKTSEGARDETRRGRPEWKEQRSTARAAKAGRMGQ